MFLMSICLVCYDELENTLMLVEDNYEPSPICINCISSFTDDYVQSFVERFFTETCPTAINNMLKSGLPIGIDVEGQIVYSKSVNKKVIKKVMFNDKEFTVIFSYDKENEKIKEFLLLHEAMQDD